MRRRSGSSDDAYSRPLAVAGRDGGVSGALALFAYIPSSLASFCKLYTGKALHQHVHAIIRSTANSNDRLAWLKRVKVNNMYFLKPSLAIKRELFQDTNLFAHTCSHTFVHQITFINIHMCFYG
jgi:hypothetical protein